MILRDKNILLVSPEPWDHIFVSKHHYAVHLGRRNNRVYFLGPPGESESLVPTEYENVVEVKFRGFPKGLRFYPGALQRHFIRKKFYELERLCNVRFDVIWSFDNSIFFDFSALLEGVLKISHIVDLNQDFQFAAAARTADICLGISRSVVEKQRAYNPRSYFVNHGYSELASLERVSIPARHSQFRIGYAGNLDLKYIDWECLQQVIAAHPEAGFFFAGPYSEDTSHIAWLRRRGNVCLLGRYPPQRLPSFYDQVDILIICYRSDDYPEQLENTHKMMEYLGSGKMIVTTFTAEYKDLSEQDLFLMGETNDQFAHLLTKAMNELEFWNNSQNQQLRKNISLDNTYEMQIERIENYISSFRID